MTQKTTSTMKKTTKFRFQCGQANHCCGQLEIGGWEKDHDRNDMWSGSKHIAKRYDSAELFGLFDRDLQEQVDDYARDGWDTSPTTGGYYAQASFVVEGAGRQHNDYKEFLSLLEHMKANGWATVARWTNPNSENTIELIGKFLEITPTEEEMNDD